MREINEKIGIVGEMNVRKGMNDKMRDRLIELIENATGTQYYGDEIVKTEIDIDEDDIKRIADYLIANGIIVPHCKVGDKVYIKNHEITINEIFLGEELLFSTYFDCDWVMENIGCEDCPFADWEQSYEGEWDCRTRGWFSFAEKDIGKTVFLTKEEAEKALKGGEHK